jgi:WD domain, G-beta repeat
MGAWPLAIPLQYPGVAAISPWDAIMRTKLTLPLIALLALFLFGWITWQPLPAQGTAKSAIPGTADQAKAMKLVLDVFGDDFADATTADKRGKLAAKLFQEGKEVKDDAVVRYVCYREARDLAAKANETGLALAIVDEIDRLYAVDALLLKADVLGLAVANASEKEAGLALVDTIRPLWNEAVDLDHYKAAHQLGEAIVAAAKKAKSPSLVLELQRRVEEVKGIEKSFGKVQGYLDRVEKDPKDAAAQYQLGAYFAFQKKRWEKALPYFARSGDKTIARLSGQDLETPKDFNDQLALADGWWDLAKDRKEGKLAIQMRAMYWYEKALPAATGLHRTKAQKRIDLVQDQLVGVTVVVQPAAGVVGEFRKYEGHADEIKSVALSHDGRYVASGSRDKTVRVWDLTVKESKELQTIRGHANEVWAVAFHPNNRNLLSVSWDATARMWDFKTGNEAKRWKHKIDVNALALARDGNTILTGSDDKNVYLWNVNTGEEIRRYLGHSDFVYAVAFSPDGRYVASGSIDKTVRVFDLATGQPVKTFDGHTDSVTNVAFTADSRFVLSAGDSVIHVWDLTTGKEAPRRFEQQNGRIPAMAISPDGKRLLTGGDDRTIKYWDVTTGKLLHTFAGHNDTITCVAFSHDGRRAVSGSGRDDRTVRVWGLPAR